MISNRSCQLELLFLGRKWNCGQLQEACDIGQVCPQCQSLPCEVTSFLCPLYLSTVCYYGRLTEVLVWVPSEADP